MIIASPQSLAPLASPATTSMTTTLAMSTHLPALPVRTMMATHAFHVHLLALLVPMIQTATLASAGTNLKLTLVFYAARASHAQTLTTWKEHHAFHAKPHAKTAYQRPSAYLAKTSTTLIMSILVCPVYHPVRSAIHFEVALPASLASLVGNIVVCNA